ncbi:MAG: hypothetical protein EOO41_04690, partial [Methanobacteriota archaeon]
MPTVCERSAPATLLAACLRSHTVGTATSSDAATSLAGGGLAVAGPPQAAFEQVLHWFCARNAERAYSFGIELLDLVDMGERMLAAVCTGEAVMDEGTLLEGCPLLGTSAAQLVAGAEIAQAQVHMTWQVSAPALLSALLMQLWTAISAWLRCLSDLVVLNEQSPSTSFVASTYGAAQAAVQEVACHAATTCGHLLTRFVTAAHANAACVRGSEVDRPLTPAAPLIAAQLASSMRTLALAAGLADKRAEDVPTTAVACAMRLLQQVASLSGEGDAWTALNALREPVAPFVPWLSTARHAACSVLQAAARRAPRTLTPSRGVCTTVQAAVEQVAAGNWCALDFHETQALPSLLTPAASADALAHTCAPSVRRYLRDATDDRRVAASSGTDALAASCDHLLARM